MNYLTQKVYYMNYIFISDKNINTILALTIVCLRFDRGMFIIILKINIYIATIT